MTEILMPQLSDQMEQGTIISWLVADGATVTAGDELCEIETDKATVTHQAETDGVVHIVVAEGATAAVGDVIAHIGHGQETAPPSPNPVGDSHPAGTAEKVPQNGHSPGPTPLAVRIAAAHAVDLHDVEGTGPRGRIVKADVFAAAGIEAPAPEPEWAPAGDLTAPSRLQRAVAKRMSESALIPQFQVATDVDTTSALELRAKLKQAAGDRPAPSVNDLLVKACALALRDHPLVNGSYREGGFELHDHVSVGVAVATDDGLLVVTIPATDTKSLTEIAAEARELATLARAGNATPQQLTGATFSVSNLGMFGMTQITALVNPPQAAILGAGAVRDDGRLTLNLSCDHRILNGADGARYLADVRRLLEQPYALAF